MKSFTFHLQKILDLKEKETEQAQWEFGKSMQKKNEEETKLVHLTIRYDEVSQSLEGIQSQSCSAANLIEMTRYKQSIERSISNQQRTIFGCEQELEVCKNKLTLHMQESQLWQKLKDKSKDSFEEEQKQKEQKNLDEIGITRYLRKERVKLS